MTVTGLWQDIGAGENGFTKLCRLFFLAGAIGVFCFLAILPLSWPQQAVLRTSYPADRAGDCAQFRLLPDHAHPDDHVHVLYLSVRILAHHRVIALFFTDPANHWGMLDAFFILCLLAAEILCIRDPLPRLLSDHLASAASTGGRCPMIQRNGRMSTS